MSILPAEAEALAAADVRAPVTDLAGFCHAVLAAAGADEATASAATNAMMHGSRLGVDSHGVRLLAHYVEALRGGRVSGRPDVKIVRRMGATAVLDAGHGHGALATYRAMEEAVSLARGNGIGAVSIRNSSHFGPAGAYACAAAAEGLIGLAVCNSDSFVRLHGGASRFHGTNPLAVAVPVAGAQPWLLDMATSAITYNKVQLFRSLGARLPEGVASDKDGADTRDPDLADMLAPLGGAFGFKGAGLAGLVEILSSVLAGMRISHEILAMGGPDFETPRQMGAFALAIDPAAFLEQEVFDDGMRRYLEALRASEAHGEGALAPGDREWREQETRLSRGVPIDPATAEAFAGLARRFGLAMPFARESGG